METKEISREDIEFIKSVEYQRYPHYMRMLQHIECLNHIRIYAGSDRIQVIVTEKYYCIFGRYTIADLACIENKSLTIKELKDILKSAKEWFKSRPVYLNAKADSSYILIKYGERKKKIKILEETSFYWKDVKMYSMKIIFDWKK